MNYPRYPEYKPSGVEWLGEVPGHWEVKRLRFVAKMNPTKSETRALSEDTPISFVPMDAVGEYGGLLLEAEKTLDEVKNGYTYFTNGDVVVAKITPCFENGKGALADGLLNGVGFGTTELHVLRSTPALDRKYLFYLSIAQPFRSIGESEMYGAGGQKRVPEEFVKDFRPGFPPIDEQRIIASFLDRETARIDALIGKKQRFIELLQEKRAALISRAVTRGLDHTVPVRDSGIEWLGKIPVHWEVMPLKRELSFVTSGSRGWAGHYSDEGKIFIRIGNLTRDSITLDLSDVQYVDVPDGTEGERTRIKDGDLLISITAYLGSVAVAPDNLGEAYVSQHVALARPTQIRATPRWLGYVLLSFVGKVQLEMQGYGGTKMQLGLEDIRSLLVLVPQRGEQQEIIDYLDRETNKLDVLRSKVESAIEKLKEYRTALIAAAVTGKIDVRARKGAGR